MKCLDLFPSYLIPQADVDVSELITLEDVMTEYSLGPNGGLVYCMDFLEKNFRWLEDSIVASIKKQKSQSNDLRNLPPYVLFDLPGQIELFLSSDSLKSVLLMLQKSTQLGFTLCSVELFDSHYIYDIIKFYSVAIYSLITLTNLELPHVNVLSKMDLIKRYGEPDLAFECYLSSPEMDFISEAAVRGNDEKFSKKYQKLLVSIGEIVDSYAIGTFTPLAIEDKRSVHKLIRAIDKALGYTLLVGEKNNPIAETKEEIDEQLMDHEEFIEELRAEVKIPGPGEYDDE